MGWTDRTVKGSVTNMIATVTPIQVPVTFTCSGDRGPYKV